MCHLHLFDILEPLCLFGVWSPSACLEPLSLFVVWNPSACLVFGTPLLVWCLEPLCLFGVWNPSTGLVFGALLLVWNPFGSSFWPSTTLAPLCVSSLFAYGHSKCILLDPCPTDFAGIALFYMA